MSSHASPAANTYNRKQYVLGMDIGGQSIRAQLFLREGDSVSTVGQDARPPEMLTNVLQEDGSPIFKENGDPEQKIVTKKGRDNLTGQMWEVVEHAYYLAQTQGGTLEAVGIGMPGRFDKRGMIKAGTASNLENRELDDDQLLSQFVPLREFTKVLKNTPAKDVAMVVDNDGDAMLSGIVEHLKHCKSQDLPKDQEGAVFRPDALRDQTALFGIGTGVGHAIVKMVKEHPQFITDGHASKLLIEVDEADKPLLEKAKTYLAKHEPNHQIIATADGRVQAECLFNDCTIRAIAGVAHASRMDSDGSALHKDALEFAGKYMARTIAAIASGQNEDINPENGWSAEDKAAAANTKNYIIGGGLGSSALGGEIIYAAKQELKKIADTQSGELAAKLNALRIVRYTGPDVAERAAAIMGLEALSNKEASIGRR